MLTEEIKATFKDAAKKLTGNRKRDFVAQVTTDYGSGSGRPAETIFGWNRQTVQLGLHERRTGIVCVDRDQDRGRPQREALRVHWAADMRSLVDGQAQCDPKFQSTFCYARISARAVRAALIQEKGDDGAELPQRQTMGAMLKRMGSRLKKPQKPDR